MSSALGIKNTAFTLATSGIVPVAMLGGTPLNAVAPTVTTLYTGVPQNNNFVPDFQEAYAYVFDGNGDIWQCNLSNGTSTQIYTVGSLRYVSGEVSPDGSYLLVCLTNNTVVKILTAAPYTVTTYIGTAGTSAYTDGVGTGAAIKGGGALFLSVDRTLMYLIDSGTLRKITLATGAITTLNAVSVPGSNSFDLGYAGAVYGGNSGALNRIGLNGTTTLIGTVPGYTASNWEWMPDSRQPAERCLYSVNSSDGKVWRYDFNTGLFSLITTLPAACVAIGKGRGGRWNGSHLITLAGSNIVKIS